MENFIFLCSGTTLVAPENLTVKRFSSTKYLLQIWYLLNRLAIIYCKKAQKEKNLFSTNYCLQSMILTEQFSLNKKWSSPLRISSVNVTKPAHITNTKEILNALMKNFIFCAVLPHRPLKNSQKKLAFLQVILLIMTTIRKKSWTVMTMTNMNWKK